LGADAGSLRFKSGLSRRSWRGQTMTVTITARGDGGSQVDVAGEANPSIQRYDWHEADFIAQRFLNELASQLSRAKA